MKSIALGLLVSLAFVLPRLAPAASDLDEPAKVLLARAEQCEKAGDWFAAAEKYNELLRLDRNQVKFRQRYNYCLRRYYQLVRFRDPSYRKDVLSLKYSRAVRLYEVVQHNLVLNALDKDRVSAGALFRTGLEEYCLALASPEFSTGHLGDLKPANTAALRSLLRTQYGSPEAMTYEQAVEKVREVVMKSKNHFPDINPTTVVMEFLCGACLAVDDYTAYLTPQQLHELCATLKGQYVGVGLRLRWQDNKIVVAEMLPDSPAAEVVPPMERDDHVVAIDKKTTHDMSPEAAMELLDGDEGTTLELVVESPVQGLRVVVLRRRALVVASVQHELMGDIGYLKIQSFQETTPHEFDVKLDALLQGGSKALILDLRGNPGGVLDAAIGIAKRFLPAGVIVSTQQPDPKSNRVYRSDNTMAILLPLVVLVDGDTASAAEVLAGALKENRRGRLVGQTTYGKGCSQGLIRLPAEGDATPPTAASLSGGIGGVRITVARFLSPTGQPYSGHGVEPDLFVEGELQLYQARAEARRLLAMQ